MIQFKKVRFKNLLSTGNIFTEIDLTSKTTIIAGHNGAGKAQPLKSQVLTPDGWNSIGDLKVGDNIIACDGAITKVIAIPYEGNDRIYKISFKDGRIVECSGNHLWRVWGYFTSKWQWKIINTIELLQLKNKKYIQLYNPVNNDKLDSDLPIDPYLLGVLIGDGSFTGSSVTITSFDNEIVEKIKFILENTTPRIIRLNLSKIDNRGGYRINYGLKYQKHEFRETLCSLGLHGKKSHEKFIPIVYKNSSKQQKIELIKGLMDTDGTCGNNGDISFSTTSYKLAVDFQSLIWSIGGICKISKKNTKYTYKGESKEGRTSYTCNVRYHTPEELFSLIRKQNRCKNYQYKDCLRLEVISIEEKEIEPVRCISIDHPTQLYVTDNWIVTHNSTFLDALCYCLYNNAYRNINKPQLVNSINNKQLVVEVELTIGATNFLIRRGQKPNIFEIYQNGNIINQSANIKDYQNMLENNILKMNEKSFRQIVVLGSAVYVPFMRLSALDRRRVIEDILDIQVFSTMNALLRSEMDAIEHELSNVEQDIEVNEKILEVEKAHQRQLQENRDEIITTKQSKIREYESNISELSSKIESLSSRQRTLQKTLSPTSKEKFTEAISIERGIQTKLSKIKKEILFFEGHDTCPTCTQELSDSFRNTYLSSLYQKSNEFKDAIGKLSNTVREITAKLERQEKTEAELQEIDATIRHHNTSINTDKQFISYLKREIEVLSNKICHVSNGASPKPGETETKLQSYKEQRAKIIRDREILGYANTLLKDSGIKARIIKQYVPIINQLINDNLRKLEFYVDFNIDETFNETILDRGRNNFSYFSFSEGEKMRIDMSILFTWREIAKLKRSTNTNLLILDEIFDSSLDQKGIDEYINMIHQLSDDTNIFIISPKAELISDKFENVITFKKVNNFSRMEMG